MRLPKPFFKLPLRLDVQRLQQEVKSIPQSAWVDHPNGVAGNSAVRLISAEGGDNDAVHGRMLPTAVLQKSPYIRQVLASFGMVWSRSRLMRLAPGASVPEHADINYHWFNRVRLHMPISTRPEVTFNCDGQSVHMAAGEVWLFDNWRLHSVENRSPDERIHLVADTTGSSAFWHFVLQSDAREHPISDLRFDSSRDTTPLTEEVVPFKVMAPAELILLITDIQQELIAASAMPDLESPLRRYWMLLNDFCKDWQQLYLLHGERDTGWNEFIKLRDSVIAASAQLSNGLVMRTNRVAVHKVLQGRVLKHVLQLPEPTTGIAQHRVANTKFVSPVFIIAAPRSGSTLLFETLSVTPQFQTLGGEAHWLVEGIEQLRPGGKDVESNRLTEQHCTESIAARIVDTITSHLHRPHASAPNEMELIRLLEKTPKNSLRIPFFNHIFPDALFVFLWRTPQPNISSIMEAWRSGKWITYNGLPGTSSPWSLLLPPGWQFMCKQPLENIAAYQWECTNRIILNDLARLDNRRWCALNYESFIQEPQKTIERLCKFMEIEFDDALAQRLSTALPLSRFTHTPPSPEKWRMNASDIDRVMPYVNATWERLKTLSNI